MVYGPYTRFRSALAITFGLVACGPVGEDSIASSTAPSSVDQSSKVIGTSPDSSHTADLSSSAFPAGGSAPSRDGLPSSARGGHVIAGSGPGSEGAGHAATASAVAPFKPGELVRVSLLADTLAVSPGKPFQLGVAFEMAPGWHIYWENPGDAGLKTTVSVDAPDGFTVDTPRLPGPIRFTSPGNVVSYGYVGETMFQTRVTPNVRPSGDSATFAVDAKWLACQESCVRGGGTATLSLPVAVDGMASGPANAEVFASHRAQLPRSWSELQGASISWTGPAETAALQIRVPGASSLEFFPASSSSLPVSSSSTAREVNAMHLQLVLHRSPPGGAAVLEGLLRVEKQASTTYYLLRVPRHGTPASGP